MNRDESAAKSMPLLIAGKESAVSAARSSPSIAGADIWPSAQSLIAKT